MLIGNRSPRQTRSRTCSLGVSFVLLLSLLGSISSTAETQSLNDRFNYLSTHGNSSCSTAYMESISKMPATARLQGSCCGPMDKTRYAEQVEGLKEFAVIAEIPPDPYDIAAGLAQKLIGYYDLALTAEEQKTYQFAMENSEEKGPCCCQCWRWKVLGGLAKYLIRERQFAGKQVTEIWNLTNGCGGAG